MGRRTVQVRRVYETPEETDGTRVLVDRLWPRALTKEKADLDEWCKDIAPSADLRRWYGHDPALFKEFRRRYRAELRSEPGASAVEHLRALAGRRRLTVLTATKDLHISGASVLAEFLLSPPHYRR